MPRRVAVAGFAAAVCAAGLLVALGLRGVGAVASGGMGEAWGTAAQAVTSGKTSVRECLIPTPNSGPMIPAVAPNGWIWVGEMGGIVHAHGASLWRATARPISGRRAEVGRGP